MPRRSSIRRRRGGVRKGRRVKGKGLFDFVKSASKFLRKHKIISSVGSALGNMGLPYAGAIGSAAGSLGFGKRRRVRRRKGYGLSPAGGALRLAGGRRKKCNKMYC